MSRSSLMTQLSQGALLLDGGMGSQFIARGIQSSKCNDYLNIESPEVVEAVHRDYVTAGSHIILTNTFGANKVVLSRHGLEDQAEAICQAGAEIARRVAGPDRYVLGDIGPCGDFLAPLGTLTTQTLNEAFVAQVRGFQGADVDGFMVETMTALDEITTAIEAVRSVCTDKPVFASMAFDRTGEGFRTMMGVSVDQAVQGLSGAGVDAIGFNCGTASLQEYIQLAETFVQEACHLDRKVLLIAEPNAGKPELLNNQAVYRVTPEEFADALERIGALGFHALGGCCGTSPAFIQAIADRRN